MAELKLIWKPEIYLVGGQMIDLAEVGRFLRDRGIDGWAGGFGGQGLCEVAGRVCYMSFAHPRPGGNAAYLKHIIESGHGSVLEHAVFNLIFDGISRSLSHELVRHRAGWGYSQLSQRYVDSADVAFVVPPALEEEVKAYLAWCKDEPNRSMDAAERIGCRWFLHVEFGSRDQYRDLGRYLEEKLAHIPDKTARRKAAREAARSVLPNCTETVVFATGNARAIRNLLEQRGSLAADAEFRRLALALAATMKQEAPDLFFDVEIRDDHLEIANHKV